MRTPNRHLVALSFSLMLATAVAPVSAYVVQATFNDLSTTYTFPGNSTAGVLNGQAGGTGFEVGSDWRANAFSSIPRVRVNDLAAPASTGFSLVQGGTPLHVEAIATSLQPDRQRNRPLLTPMTGTIWMSFLLNTNGSETEIAGIGFTNRPEASSFNDRPSILAIGTSLVYNPDRALRLPESAGLVVTVPNAIPATGDALILARLVIDSSGAVPSVVPPVLDIWVNPDLTNPLPAPTINIPDVKFPNPQPGGGYVGYRSLVSLDRVAVGGSNTITSPSTAVSGGKFDFLTISNDNSGYTDVTGVAQPLSTSAWIANSDGAWAAAANWSPYVPTGTAATATFGSAITAPRTVTLTSAQLVRQVSFDNSESYTLNGTSSLTLSSVAGAGITVSSGSHTISAPVQLATNATIEVSPAGSTLTVSNLLPASTATLTKTGSGVLAVNNVRTADLTVSAGTVRVPANGTESGTSLLGTLTVNPGATFDLTDNNLIIDYAATSPLDQLTAWLASGELTANPSHMGVPTTLAIVEASDLGLATFDLLPVDSSTVVLKYTYAGDTNLDGILDGTDVANVIEGYSVGLSGWAWGDVDQSGGPITSTDVALLIGALDSFNANNASGLGGIAPSGAIPEPAGLGLLAAVAALGTRRRRN